MPVRRTVMPYTADEPQLPPNFSELRDRIPGWGIDLDPRDRPAYPRERFEPETTGAHWEFPERQTERHTRERSIEHGHLTPVFGTSTPLKGLSGRLRRIAYERYSEARAAHWLILLGADRVDAWESHLLSFLTLRPDNPITETGILSERSRHGYSSRVGHHRADLGHAWIDPILVGGPWVAIAGAVFMAAKSLFTPSQDEGDVETANVYTPVTT
jgi:hypothetical protein